jgi:hypothetical protein
MDGIRGGALIGFYAARAVMLARAGWLLGWPSERRLWDYILDVVRDIQRRFTSWSDYAVDFQLSRNVWRGSNDRDQTAVFFDGIIKHLLTEARSSWRTLPWQVSSLEAPLERLAEGNPCLPNIVRLSHMVAAAAKRRGALASDKYTLIGRLAKRCNR